MNLTLSSDYRLPAGRAFAAAMAKLFALQGSAVLRQLPIHSVNLASWDAYFADKMLPYYVWHFAEGWRLQQSRVRRVLPYRAAAKAKKKKDDEDDIWLLALLGMFGAEEEAALRAMARKYATLINQTTTRRVNEVLARTTQTVRFPGGAADWIIIPTGGTRPWSPEGGLSQAQIEAEVKKIFDDAPRTRIIGGDEAARAFHQGMLGALGDARWTKTWRTAQDEVVCPICFPLDGVTVPVGESFLSRPTEGNSRGILSMASAPPIHVLCRCRLEWSLVVQRREAVGV